MNTHEFSLPVRIIFGEGSIDRLSALAKKTGKRTLLVTGRKSSKENGALGKAIETLNSAGIETLVFDKVNNEPDTGLIDEGLKVLKAGKCDFVIGLGGGSAMDTAKAIAGLAPIIGNNSTSDFLEVDGKIKPSGKGLDFISIPTVSGTGAEVTNNAVLLNTRTNSKRSLRNESMFARAAILDPGLISGVPPAIASVAGIDCLAHLAEGYFSRASNRMTDIYACEGLKFITQHLPGILSGDKDVRALENLMLSSVYGGILIFNAGLGLAHGIASIIGPRYNIPHGLSCAIFISRVAAYNLRELTAEKTKFLENYFGKDIPEGIDSFIKKCGIRTDPAFYGIRKEDIGEIVAKTLETSSAKKNPRLVTRQSLTGMLAEAIQ